MEICTVLHIQANLIYNLSYNLSCAIILHPPFLLIFLLLVSENENSMPPIPEFQIFKKLHPEQVRISARSLPKV